MYGVHKIQRKVTGEITIMIMVKVDLGSYLQKNVL